MAQSGISRRCINSVAMRGKADIVRARRLGLRDRQLTALLRSITPHSANQSSAVLPALAFVVAFRAKPDSCWLAKSLLLQIK